MSLYCFGKIILHPRSRRDFVFPTLASIDNAIDPEDAKDLDHEKSLSGEGPHFTVRDDPGSAATGLWNEVSNRPSDELVQTRLGGFVYTLMFHPSILVGGIAFVDGGIETVVEGSRADCWRGFTGRIRQP